jgi:hypothetical protein
MRVTVIQTTHATSLRFDPDAIGHLPVPVVRWLRHTIEPETLVGSGVRVDMHGTIRIGRWRPFTARQTVGPDSYIWAAESGRFPLRISGFDRYTGGAAEMRWRLDGLIPVVTASGDDVTRSAAGRHASEMIGLVPGGALAPGVTWRGIDFRRAVATVDVGEFTHEVTIEVDDLGVLRSVRLPRWGNPDQGPFEEHIFGVMCEGERDFGGCALPATLRAGWWPGTDRWAAGEFFRCEIDRAEFP